MATTKQKDENMGSGDIFTKKIWKKLPLSSKNLLTGEEDQKKILIRQKIAIFSILYQVAITFLTIYSLFGDDFRTVAFQKKDDMAFDGINIALMVIFFLQIILSSLVLENYFLCFFFFLDFINLFSLLFDISIFNGIIYLSSYTNDYTYSKMARQSKATRAAIRAIRVVKLFRIIRIVKLYKSALKAEQISQKKQKQIQLKQKLRLKFDRNLQIEQQTMGKALENYYQQNVLPPIRSLNNKKIYPQQMLQSGSSQNVTPIIMNLPHLQEDQIKQNDIQRLPSKEQVNEMLDTTILQEMDKRESKIRKILGDITLKKVIIVVLLLMFIVPLFDTELYIDQANAFDLTLSNLNNLLLQPSSQVSTPQISALIDKILNDHKGDEFELVYFSTPFNELPSYKHDLFLDVRIGDIVSSSTAIDTAYIMANRPDLTLRSNLADDTEKTSLLCMLDQQNFNTNVSYLSMGRTLFICLLLIALLYLFNKDVENLIVHPIYQMMFIFKSMAGDPEAASKEQIDPNAQYETTIVSNAIMKIGALLSIVFGSAGAQIIGKNIVQQGDMNPMLEEKKKMCYFRFL